MKASEVTLGRTFGVTFEHGDDFMSSLASFCRETMFGKAISRCFWPGSPRQK